MSKPAADRAGQMGALLRHPIAIAITSVGGAAVFSQLAALAAAPLLARLYPAEAFGQLGAILAFANILAPLLLLGLSDAILSAHDDDAAIALLGAALRLLVLLLFPATGFTLVAIHFGWFGLAVLPITAAALAVPLLAMLVLLSLLQAMLGRQLRFGALARAYVTLGWVRALAQLLGGWLGATFGGLAGGELIGRLLANLVKIRGLDGQLSAAWRVPAAEWRNALHDYRKFPIMRTPSTLISAIAVSAPVLMIAALYGPTSAGQFSLMLTLLLGPIAILQRAVGDVFIGHFGQQYRKDRSGALRMSLRFAAGLATLGLLFALVLSFAGQWLFTLVLGAAWAQAGAMAALCAPWMAAMILVMPLSQIINVTHRPELKLLFDLSFALALGGLFWWARYHAIPPLAFVQRLSLLSTASYLLYLPLLWLAVRRPGAMLHH